LSQLPGSDHRKRPIASSASRALKILAAIAVLVPLSSLYESIKLFHSLEPFFLNSDVGTHKPKSINLVSRVWITREDYESRFGGKSPLDPRELGSVIEAIVKQHPAVVVVDIDTSSSCFGDLYMHSLQLQWPIVWARDAVYSMQFKQYWPARIFGGPVPFSTNFYGLAVLPLEEGVVRRYSRLVTTDHGDQVTIAWAALEKARMSDKFLAVANRLTSTKRPEPSIKPLLIRFGESGDYEKVGNTMRPLFSFFDIGALKDLTVKDLRLTGKIVLLGGRYDPSDEHWTPIGPMFGVDIIAQIIETELDGDGNSPVGTGSMYVGAFSAALLLWLMVNQLRRIPFRFAVPLGVVFVILLAGLSSFVMTGTLRLLRWFFLILLVVLAYQIWNRFQETKSKLSPT
jgi:CHASE2 domain-containing sensor protein